jgi:ABC-type amino acid transport substrate-binding protein
MRIVKLALIAAVALCAAACSQKSGALAPVKTDAKAFEAELAALPGEQFVLKTDGPADIGSLVAAVPKSIKVTYATVTFDAASGATIINQLRISPSDQPDIGLVIDQMKVWGLDAKAATDRLTGQNLDQTVRIARRIDATGVTPFGLEKLLAPAIDASNQVVTGVIEDQIRAAAPDADPEDIDVQSYAARITGYDIGIGRLIVEDLYLRPWEIRQVTLPSDNAIASLMPFAQGYAAGTRAIAFDLLATYETTISMTMTQMGRETAMSGTVATVGYRGWRGGDIDLALLSNMQVKLSEKMPTAPEAPPLPFVMKESIGRYTLAGIRIEKALGYLARGEMPPRTESDLLSLGQISMENLTADLNGHPFFSMDKGSADLSKFHWLIPVKGKLSAQNVAYDIPGVLAFAEDAANMGGGSETEPVPTIPPAIIPILAKYGLDKPSMDFDFGWDWNPKTGAARIDTSYGLDGYDRYDIAADFVLPTFDGVSALVPETGEPETAAIGDLFSKTSALKSASFNLVDEGGLEKIFAVIIEIAKAMPDDDPSMGPLRALTPEGLRGMASSGAYMLADQAGAQMPAAKDWLRPFAAWVTEGGAVHARMKPKAPVVFSTYGGQVSSGAIAPEAALDAFNLSVTHEPPKGGAKKPN